MRINLFFLACIYAITSFSQQKPTSKEFNYTFSKPYEVIDGVKWYFNVEGTNIVSFKMDGNDFYFQKFGGPNLDEIMRVPMERLPKKSRFEEILKFQDKIYFFYSLKDDNTGVLQLFARELDYVNGKFKPDRCIVKEENKVSNAFIFSKFNIYSDLNESKILVQYRMVPDVKNDDVSKDIIGFHTFTKDLEEIWHSIVTMPYTEKKMNNVAYCLDDQANVYLLSEIYKDETTDKFKKDGTINYDLEVIRIDKDDQKLTIKRISLENRRLIDYGFYNGNNNELILAGYYSNEEDRSADGVYTYVFNGDGEIIKSSTNEFDINVIKQFESEKSQRKIDKSTQKNGVGIDNLEFDHLIHHEDGSITAIGEVYYYTVHYNGSTGSTSYDYFYNSIIACKISEKGDMLWMKKLPKYQEGNGLGGLSYSLLFDDNNYYFVYLDNIKNLNLGLNETPEKHVDGRGGYLTAYKVDVSTGDVEKSSIFNTAEVNNMSLHQFQVDRVVKIGDKEFAVEFYKKRNEDVMVKVKFTE